MNMYLYVCVCVHLSNLSFCFLQDTVSVHRPSFYADRYLKFMGSTVFKKLHRESSSRPHCPSCPLQTHTDTLLQCSVSSSLSSERSVLQEEEEFPECSEVGVSGVSVPTEGGEEAGEESAEHGQPGWKLYGFNQHVYHLICLVVYLIQC